MKTPNSAITVCSCIALISFSVLCASGVWALRSVNAAVVALPNQVDQRIASAQKDLTGQVSKAVVDVNNRIAESLAIMDQRSGQALKIVDDRTAEIVGPLVDPKVGVIAVAGGLLTQTESDLNERLTDTNKILSDTAKPITESAQQVNAALPDFLDCQYDETGIGNKNCLYVRYGDLSSSLDRTLSAVAKSAPAMADDVKKMADSSVVTSDSVAATSVEVKKAAQNFNKPQTKMQAFRSWMLTAARIFGAI